MLGEQKTKIEAKVHEVSFEREKF